MILNLPRKNSTELKDLSTRYSFSTICPSVNGIQISYIHKSVEFVEILPIFDYFLNIINMQLEGTKNKDNQILKIQSDRNEIFDIYERTVYGPSSFWAI